MMELYRAIDAGAYGYGDADVRLLTGRAATGIREWCDAVKGGFAA
jgi:hypothetical protein